MRSELTIIKAGNNKTIMAPDGVFFSGKINKLKKSSPKGAKIW